MIVQQYSVNQNPIQTLLSWVQSGEVAIPEIQRPFVWDASKVRDLMDSLYRGYPIGYLITWRNPNVKLKDGSISAGKRIVIDGQQRITALMAALLGVRIVNKDYRKDRITIAFHPVERKFEVSNPAIQKDKAWIPDISSVFSPEFRMLKAMEEYCLRNDIENRDAIHENLESLKGIINNHVGLIELDAHLDIETVSEIFIRINSTGAILSQADFAMSKIAVNESYGGNTLRKAIDYFCHLAVNPDFYDQLVEVDNPFTKADYFQKMSWLRKENGDLYNPSYTDMLRVAFISEFKRGRLQDLVALLSGRNFETRGYEEDIAENSFAKLRAGILNYINETHFKRLLMILRSAGFVDTAMIGSQNSINFAYVLYLALRNHSENAAHIESLVRKWFVLSVLTGRYSGSPETRFDTDIRRIHDLGATTYIQNVVDAELSETFWKFGLPQQLETSLSTNPSFQVFLAAQVNLKDKGLFSKDITVYDLIEHKGDKHHIFPRKYLKNLGFKQSHYNQVANYVMTQSEINIAIGAKPPSQYFKEVLAQCNGGDLRYGGIVDREQLLENFHMNCIPEGIEEMRETDYDRFLKDRRKLMARKIEKYFAAL